MPPISPWGRSAICQPGWETPKWWSGDARNADFDARRLAPERCPSGALHRDLTRRVGQDEHMRARLVLVVVLAVPMLALAGCGGVPKVTPKPTTAGPVVPTIGP